MANSETTRVIPLNGTFRHRQSVAFDELDALWVMHHANQVKAIERAHHAFFLELLGADAFDPDRYEDLYVVVRNIDANFHIPIRGVTDIIIELKITRVREAGLSVAFSVCSVDGSLIHTSGERIICRMSARTHQPCGWTPAFRQAAEAWYAQ